MNYFNEKIIDLLKNQVLNLSVDQIKEIYQVFDNGGIKEIENQDVHQVFQDFLNQHEVVKKQFDLPFFIDNKKKKMLMIVGMDAKASHSGNHIVLSTPYYLQAEGGRNTNANDYWKIIEVLSTEFNIYLTDVYKAYFVQENTISNTLPSYTSNSIHKELMKKEIVEVRPDALLCWGREARDLVADLLDIKLKSTISKDDIRNPYVKEIEGVSFAFLATPHPSRLTRPKSWESFFSVNLPGEDYSDSKLRPKKLANFIISAVN
ncbi:MAG: hypothetical protein ACK48V_04665 [Crocinitomicaceae bacterium]|jgi:hypothetical protein